jgi:hypothetical protein
MATSYLFGAGTLTIGANEIPVSQITMEDSSETIDAWAGEDFPMASANGKRTVKGTFSVTGYEDTLLDDITAAVMAPIGGTPTTLAWELPASGGGTTTFTLASVLITDKKVSGGNDKFMTMECSYKAMRGAAGAILTIT